MKGVKARMLFFLLTSEGVEPASTVGDCVFLHVLTGGRKYHMLGGKLAVM